VTTSPFNWQGKPSGFARELEASRQKSERQTRNNMDGKIQAIVYSRASTPKPVTAKKVKNDS
jgi:hypothetical protein